MTVRMAAAALWLALLALALALPARPKPLAVEDVRPAKAKLWVEVGPAPPQFCPSPMPLCRGAGCPRPVSRA